MRSIALALLLITPSIACRSDEPAAQAATATPPRKDPAAARALIAQGAPVVDVRTQAEWDEEHLTGAVHIPLGSLRDRVDEVARLVGGDRSRPVVVYCASGNRSGIAAQRLAAAGFTRIVNGGGLDDLQ